MYVDGKTEKEVGVVIASNMKKLRVNEEDAEDRVKWKCRAKVPDPK